MKYFRDMDNDLWKWDDELIKCSVYILRRNEWENDDPTPSEGDTFENANCHWHFKEISEEEFFTELL